MIPHCLHEMNNHLYVFTVCRSAIMPHLFFPSNGLKTTGSDPVSGVASALRKSGVAVPIPTETLLSHIMTQPLKNDPGIVSEYCNFGYETLRYVLEKFSGRRPGDYFRNILFKPESVTGFYGAGLPLHKSAPPLVWNAESGGPISASAPTLLKFMHRYWLTGEPRDSGNPLWVMYGSLDGSTAIMVWRPDGIDLVALFNGRGSVTHDEISRALQAVIERLKESRGSILTLRSTRQENTRDQDLNFKK